jgi:hypothetical protein
MNMEQTQSPFARFANIPASEDIETARSYFAAVVGEIAAAFTGPDAFRAELNRQLALASFPSAQFLARGAEREVLRLPLGLVAKVEYSKSRKRIVEASANYAEWNATNAHPSCFPTLYGYHGHVTDEVLVSVLIVEEVLPLDKVIARLGRIATDARQIRNLGVRFDSGQLLIADGGDSVVTEPLFADSPYGREWASQ